ncbi:serine/threonine-protein kinase [Nocardia africana]|uniref:serine/threonine-protein kinase n=1 Tax=Nocardia africana TaxID=134964 RepID=UPI001C3F8B32|nr:serine/threonine-protein kinase [Nocardia africana]MCC3317417.1 serine/threonine protein kinase [Nocardia africana]
MGGNKILAVIGQGAMGRVLLGRAPDGRLVAIKQVHRHFAHDQEFRARFAREVEASRRVTGAYTAAIVDADPQGPVPWLSSVFVTGPTLEEAITGAGPLNMGGLRLLIGGLAAALSEIHRAGMVHRDLKPSNVLLAQDGPRVIDFGIARAVDGEFQLTSAGAVIGSPSFMSPEQAEGRNLTAASDVFSVGAVVFMASTGVSPFLGASTPQTLYNVVHSVADLSRVDPVLQSIVGACLQKNPGDRPSVDELLDFAGSIRAEPLWPAAVQRQIDHKTREVAYWASRPDEGGTHQRRSRVPRRSAAAVVAFVIAAASGVGMGVLLPRTSISGTATKVSDPPLSLSSEQLRLVDACALLDERIIGPVGKRRGQPNPSITQSNECSISIDTSGSTYSTVDVTVGGSASSLVLAGQDNGNSMGGMRVFGGGSSGSDNCAITAVLPDSAQLGITVKVRKFGDSCGVAASVLRSIVFRLAVNPPLRSVTPNSVLGVDPCGVVKDNEVVTAIGKPVSKSLTNPHSCLWSGESGTGLSIEADETGSSDIFAPVRIGDYTAYQGGNPGIGCLLYLPLSQKAPNRYETLVVGVLAGSSTIDYQVACDRAAAVLLAAAARVKGS